MNTLHKHASLIHTWADGAIIQFKDIDGEWCDCRNNTPRWSDPNDEYRIKPEPKPDVVEYRTFGKRFGYSSQLGSIEYKNASSAYRIASYPSDDVKNLGVICIIYDGETGKLKDCYPVDENGERIK